MNSLFLYVWKFFISWLPSYNIKNIFCRSLLKFDIDKTVSMHSGIYLTCRGNISIGKYTTINRNVLLDARGGIVVGDMVSISPDVKIITASHDLDSSDFALELSPVKIEKLAWIGSGAILLPGVVVGKGAVIAAGSVVTKSVSPYTVVGGNPARYIRNRSTKIDYKPFWRPLFS